MSNHAPVLGHNGLDNGNYTIVSVADPVNPQDAATKAFSTNASNLATGTVPLAVLPTSGVAAGTYNSVTVDVYGRVTAATSVSVSSLTNQQTTAGAVGVVGKYPVKALTVNKTFAATDDEQPFRCDANGLTLTMVAGMGWIEGVVIFLPVTAGQTVTIVSDGTVKLNGSTSAPVTRTTSSQQQVITVCPRGTDDLVVTGF